jgi:8-oxo-dGTP diphosphatase
MGAAFNTLMEEETKESLAELCCKLMDEIAFEKDKPAAELPRLVACAIILHNGKVLLEKRAPTGVQGLDNGWDIPGGKVEARETIEQAAEREILEEIGITVQASHLCPEPIPSVWSYPGKGERHWLLVGVVCFLAKGEPQVSDRLQWFPVHALPDGTLDADRKLIRQALSKQYEFLDDDFLTLMNDIGRLGHEKFQNDSFEVAGNKRRIARHRKEEIMAHAHRHLWSYEDGVRHDKTVNLQGHLGAVAFNAMLEFIFSQGE